MNRFQHSFDLWHQSLSLLQQDKDLLLFPVMSFGTLILAAAVLLFPTARSLIISTSPAPQGINIQTWHIIILFLWYFVTYGIMYFFNAGLIGCALMGLDGKKPTVRDGLNIARANLSRIAGWAAVAATVGLILQALENIKVGGKGGEGGFALGSILAGILGLSWTVLTYMVVPALIVEQIGPIEAIKRSGSLLKKTWGEQVIGAGGIGLVTFLLGLIGVLPILTAVAIRGQAAFVVGMTVALLYWQALGALSSALSGIYRAALYRYSTTGQAPEGFSKEDLSQAFRSKSWGFI